MKKIQIICLNCGSKHKKKEKEVFGIWEDTCDICGKKDVPCADAYHDFGIYGEGDIRVRGMKTYQTQLKDKRKKFIKMYANIPLGARKEIVAIVKKRNLTYQVIYGLIVAGDLADKALEKMEAMDIL